MTNALLAETASAFGIPSKPKSQPPATGTNSATLASTALTRQAVLRPRSLFPSALSDASSQDFKILFVAPGRRCQIRLSGRPMGVMATVV